MPYEFEVTALPPLLDHIRNRALADGVAYAGGVPPLDAWRLVEEKAAVLVDVRTGEERKFVGHVPQSLHRWGEGHHRAIEPVAREFPSRDALARLTNLLKGALFPLRLGPPYGPC